MQNQPTAAKLSNRQLLVEVMVEIKMGTEAM
jgi:hypothetical protein